MKPICFIGARGGSKGILRKNIRRIAGKPLIAHTIETAIKSNIFQDVIVSTEDHEIASIARKYGAEVPFIRPRRLARDNSGMIDVIIHAIRKLHQMGYEFDVLVNRDCTVPFIKSADMKGAIDLLKRKKCDAVYAVYRQHHNPYFNMMEIGPTGFLKLSKTIKKKIKTRQAAPIVYQINGLHVFDINQLLKKGGISKLKALPYEIPIETGWMIDTEFEFRIAELMFCNKNFLFGTDC
jgi:CMP-N-acetylneuraminic acid synthetase